MYAIQALGVNSWF